MNNFFAKNKVMIIGLLSAVFMPIYDLMQHGETSVMTIGMAAAVALTSYLARNLRGQWATIAGIVGTVLASYLTERDTGHPISILQLLVQGLTLFFAAVSSPAKSIGYEHTDVIKEAKIEGEAMTPTVAPPQP